MKILDIEYSDQKNRCQIYSRLPPYLALLDSGDQVTIYLLGEERGTMSKRSCTIAILEQMREEAAVEAVGGTTPPEAA